MKKKIQLLESGISLVDKTWGGFYRGGTYLLIGPRKSGRTLLGLQFAMEAASQNETCLYFTTVRPKDLMIHAASIDFDLQHFMNQNAIIVVRVAPPLELNEAGNPDEILSEYLTDIVSVVEQYQPSKLVFDELTHFVSFNNINLLQNTYLKTIEKIEEFGITSLLLLGQPVTPGSRLIADVMLNNSTGVIHLNKKDPDSMKLEGGRISITPNIGHTEGDFSANYIVEPYKGIVDDYNEKTSTKKVKRYKTLDQFNLVEDKTMQTNIYPPAEFKLIINNQVALYRSTGQTFHLISIKLNADTEKKGMLTFNQLQSAVKLSVEKKDRLCVLGEKLLVLIPKSNEKSFDTFASKLRNNLPGSNTEYLSEVLPNISLMSTSVDDKTHDADELLDRLLSDESAYNGIN